MKKLAYLVLVIFCALNTKGQAPAWADYSYRNTKYPATTYLSGFVTDDNVRNESQIDFLDHLTDIARLQLAMSLKITIEGTSEIEIKNIQEKTSMQFKQKSKLIYSAKIPNLRTETYYDQIKKKGFVFLYVLKDDLINHYTNILKIRQKEISISTEDINVSKISSEKNGKLVGVANELLSSFKETEEAQVMLQSLGIYSDSVLLISEIQQRKKVLNDYIKLIREDLIESILLSPPKSINEFTQDCAMKTVLINVRDKNDKPLNNIPVFFIIKGGDTIPEQVLSDEHGCAKLQLTDNKLLNKYFSLQIYLDVAKFLNVSRESLIYKEVVRNLRIPEASVNVKILSCKFLATSTEYQFGELPQVKVLMPKLKEALAAQGYAFTDIPEEATYMLVIDAKMREGRSMQGMFTTYADAVISIKRIKDKTEVYQNSWNDFKGIGRSFEQAGIKAYEQLSIRLNSDMAEYIQRNF